MDEKKTSKNAPMRGFITLVLWADTCFTTLTELSFSRGLSQIIPPPSARSISSWPKRLGSAAGMTILVCICSVRVLKQLLYYDFLT